MAFSNFKGRKKWRSAFSGIKNFKSRKAMIKSFKWSRFIKLSYDTQISWNNIFCQFLLNFFD